MENSKLRPLYLFKLLYELTDADEFVDTITPVENYRFRWKLNFDHSYNPCHADLMAITADPILTFSIDFETAKQYRESRKMDHRFRKTQWNDLVVEVYL